LVRHRFVLEIDIRTTGLRIETLENVLIDERLAFDELDRSRAALEEPDVTIARAVDQAFDRAAVALVVDEDRRRHFIPIPCVVRVVLVIALARCCGHIDRNDRRGVEVVSRTTVADRWTAVAGSPERKVSFRIVVPGYPHRRAAGLPRIILWPRLTARL